MYGNHDTYAPRRKYRYNKLPVPLDMNGVDAELNDIGKIVYIPQHCNILKENSSARSHFKQWSSKTLNVLIWRCL